MKFVESTTKRQQQNGTVMLEDVNNPGRYFALTKSGKVYKVSKIRVKTVTQTSDGNTKVSTRVQTKYNCINHVKNGERSNINSIVNQIERARNFSDKNSNLIMSKTEKINDNTIVITSPLVS